MISIGWEAVDELNWLLTPEEVDELNWLLTPEEVDELNWLLTPEEVDELNWLLTPEEVDELNWLLTSEEVDELNWLLTWEEADDLNKSVTWCFTYAQSTSTVISGQQMIWRHRLLAMRIRKLLCVYAPHNYVREKGGNKKKKEENILHKRTQEQKTAKHLISGSYMQQLPFWLHLTLLWLERELKFTMKYL